MKNKNRSKNKRCADCYVSIDDRAARCKSCARIKIVYTEEDELLKKQTLDLYKKGATLREILNKIDRKKTWFYTLLKQNNIPHRDGKTYYFDDTVLDKDSSTKFYLLGLFATDGCIGLNRKSKYIDISLHKKDRILLEDIKKFFKTTKPLNPSVDQLRFTLYSEKLFDLFCEWGIGPNKSLTLEIKKEIPLEFLHDFLRGVFDGDGCISGEKINKTDVDFCFSGSELFANQIKSFYNKLGYDVNLYRYHYSINPLWVVKKSGKNGLRILSNLYRPGDLYLPRKYEKFLSLSRMTLDETMMETAYLFSKRSTCGRAKVGCVLTDENKNNIISVGYNGGISGLKNHCESSMPGQCGCIHAEPGALIKGKGPILYCTHMPCYQCAKLITNAGIKKVYYSEQYRNRAATALFSQKKIPLVQIKRENYLWKLKLLEDK